MLIFSFIYFINYFYFAFIILLSLFFANYLYNILCRIPNFIQLYFYSGVWNFFISNKNTFIILFY